MRAPATEMTSEYVSPEVFPSWESEYLQKKTRRKRKPFGPDLISSPQTQKPVLESYPQPGDPKTSNASKKSFSPSPLPTVLPSPAGDGWRPGEAETARSSPRGARGARALWPLTSGVSGGLLARPRVGGAGSARRRRTVSLPPLRGLARLRPGRQPARCPGDHPVHRVLPPHLRTGSLDDRIDVLRRPLMECCRRHHLGRRHDTPRSRPDPLGKHSFPRRPSVHVTAPTPPSSSRGRATTRCPLCDGQRSGDGVVAYGRSSSLNRARGG